jgi:4-hydroxy-tetrahydrodipicolinate synthase
LKQASQLGAQLQTIVGINITPFGPDLSIDFDDLGRNLDFLVQQGVKVIVPCGNTGEFSSLTIEESLEIISFSSKRLKGQATLIAGIGYATDTAIQLAKHAQAAGYDGVMVHHPSHPYLSNAGYVDYVRCIAERIDIAVIPYVRSARISNESLYELGRLPNVVAVKYAVNDLQRFGDLVAHTPSDVEITWVCGTAESWAPFFFAAGAKGFTSGLVNVSPQFSFKMLAALQSGDSKGALDLWKAIKPFEDLRARNESENNVSVVKEAMHQLGLGSRRVRPPISELTSQDRNRVRQILQSWGLSPRDEGGK